MQPSPRPACPARPARPEPTEAQLRGASRWLRLSMLLMFGTYLAAMLELPWKIAALLLAAGGITAAVVALVKGVRAGLPALHRLSAVVALLASVLVGSGALGQIAFWQQTAELQQCHRLALTQRSIDKCTLDYTRQVTDLSRQLTEIGTSLRTG